MTIWQPELQQGASRDKLMPIHKRSGRKVHAGRDWSWGWCTTPIIYSSWTLTGDHWMEEIQPQSSESCFWCVACAPVLSLNAKGSSSHGGVLSLNANETPSHGDSNANLCYPCTVYHLDQLACQQDRASQPATEIPLRKDCDLSQGAWYELFALDSFLLRAGNVEYKCQTQSMSGSTWLRAESIGLNIPAQPHSWITFHMGTPANQTIILIYLFQRHSSIPKAINVSLSLTYAMEAAKEISWRDLQEGNVVFMFFYLLKVSNRAVMQLWTNFMSSARLNPEFLPLHRRDDSSKGK